MKKKILFIMSSLGNGGAERSLVNLLNEIPYDKYEVDLLLFKQSGMFLSQVPKDVNIIEKTKNLKRLFGPISEAGILFFYKITTTFLTRFLEKDRDKGYQTGCRWKFFYKNVVEELDKEYDIAISYISGEQTYYLVDKVKAKRKITWIHNDYVTAHQPKKYDESYFNQLDAIVTISDQCLEILKEEFPGLKDKCYCIANITSSKVVKLRAEEFFPLEYNNEGTRLLSIGRLSEQKGFDFAITAARILKSKGFKFKWFIIGSGNLKKQLQKQINEEKVNDCIELIGPRENPYPYIKNCDIFIQPSRYEGKSVVIDECKILGKSMILTRYPTVNDQINNKKEAIIAEMNSQSIADKVELLIKNEKVKNEMENYLKQNEYGNQKEIQKYIRIFEGNM